MNLPVPVVPRGAPLLLALGVLVALVAQPALGPAQTEGLPPAVALRRAEEHFAANSLLQAEGLYRQALKAATGADRRRCYDRLLDIYSKVGRQDQAIQIGLEYEERLSQQGELERAREVTLLLGRWYFTLGHHADAERHLRKGLSELKNVPLSPVSRLTALSILALNAERQRDRKRTGEAWREVETFAGNRLEAPAREVELPLRIDCTRELANSYRFQGRFEAAIPLLEGILPAFEELKKPDWIGKRDTLRQLASHLKEVRQYAAAETRLKEALEIHRRHGSGDRLFRADLSADLSDVLERQGQTQQAAALRQQAAQEYRAVLEEARGRGAGTAEVTRTLAAFTNLLQLYQRSSQLLQALQIIQDQSAFLAGTLVEVRLNAEQGRIQIELGDYKTSRKLLAGVVEDLEKQTPRNLIELPRAMLNLAVADLAAGLDTSSVPRAMEMGKRCLDLYRKHDLPEDMVLVAAYNLLGTCAGQDADYAKAIAHFREAVRRCSGQGAAADPMLCDLLLNIAVLHRAQGDLERALNVFEEARKVYTRIAPKDSPGFLALDAARALMLANQKRTAEAGELAAGVLKGCQRLGIKGGALVITALHCQAIQQFRQKDFTGAEATWREVEKLHGPKSLLRARTLNYLGMCREVQNQLDAAAKLYEEARRLHRDNPQAYPLDHLTSLVRLANVTYKRDKRKEARVLLEEAIALIEKARLRTYGDAQQRATFFQEVGPAFEDLVKWCILEGDTDAAVAASARGRSRTLLEQLLLANVDPRKGLNKQEADRLLPREAELRRRIAALRASLPLLAPDSPQSEAVDRLQEGLHKAQEDYSEVYRDILNASAVYRSLARKEFTTAELTQLRDSAIGPKKLLLMYHVDRDRSYLVLIGDRTRPPEVFWLGVSEEVAERVSLEELKSKARGGETCVAASSMGMLGSPLGKGPVLAALRVLPGSLTRGKLELRLTGKQPQLPPTPAKPAKRVPLGHNVLRSLVESYLEKIESETFEPTRGLELRPRSPGRPVPVQRPDFLGDMLLPAAARERIRKLDPECLIVVPDGPLHKLPFEALLVRSGDRSAYVLDELPPIVYAPSMAILSLLAERKPGSTKEGGPRSLLTVADPLYPQDHQLKFAATESNRIRGFFDRKQVEEYLGERATKKALVEAVEGREVIHIAAHGIAETHFGNRFGGLLLTTPAGERITPEDDGFLALDEIYSLPLSKCELAVLSACVTNSGPQRPLEAGVTLSGAFLAAGARRVVASHWRVNDASTAELMGAFFEEVTAAVKADRPVSYAKALQKARRQVRDQTRWASPLFWAPFVLVGSAN